MLWKGTPYTRFRYLGQITSLQARMITYACEKAVKRMSAGGWILADRLIIDLANVKRITQVDDIHRLDRELDHLRALELMHGFDDIHRGPTSRQLHSVFSFICGARGIEVAP